MENEKKPDFNRNHPELKKGEIFLINIMSGQTIFEHMVVQKSPESERLYYPAFKRISTGGVWGDFDSIDFKSKRLGKKAYNAQGQIIQGRRPVFVSLWEFKEMAEKKGFTLDRPFKDYPNFYSDIQNLMKFRKQEDDF